MTQSQKKHLSYLLAENPLDLIATIIFVIAVYVLGSIYVAYQNNALTLSPAAKTQIIEGIVGFALMLLAKVIAITWKPKKQKYSKLKTPQFFGANFDPMMDATGLGFTIGTYFGIEILGSIIQQYQLFQSTVEDVYAFFASCAVTEEVLFRGGILMLTQIIIARLANLDSDSHWGATIPAVGISAALFMWSHIIVYGDNTVAMILTFCIGVSQGAWTVRNRNLWAAMLAHGAGNVAAAKTVVQGLQL
jgi:membrane protease YdiL (CAAX protease family)